MSKRFVKVIKGTGPELTLEQLEQASLRLLVSRIRGSEPQISFTFVQRLLDEVIRCRHKAAKESRELERISHLVTESDPLEAGIDGLDEKEISAVSFHHPDDWVVERDPFESELDDPEEDLPLTEDFEFLSDDLPLTDSAHPLSEGGSEGDSDELPETAYDEPILVHNPPRRRGATVATCSKNRNAWTGGLNLSRVLVVSLLAVFAMVCGVVFAGCGHHHDLQHKQNQHDRAHKGRP